MSSDPADPEMQIRLALQERCGRSDGDGDNLRIDLRGPKRLA